MALFGKGCLRSRGVVLAATLLSGVACGRSSTPNIADAIPVRGSERLAWEQAGYIPDLRFRAYVDGVPVPLDGATCDASKTGPQGFPCISPLPPLGDGVHTIALAAVSLITGLESARSGAITVQKLSAGATRSASSQAEEGDMGPSSRDIPETLTTGDGLTFDVRVVVSRLEAPTQLAPAPDGRLFVAERTGRVQIVRTSGPALGDSAVALDPHAVLGAAAAGPPGIALHPDFRRNRLVYFASVTLDGRDQAHLQVVRLREVGDTLGEPAVLFDEALAGVPAEGPRLAFGPDRLLYIALSQGGRRPPEAPFTGTLGGAFLRLKDDGRVVDGSAVFSYGVGQPVGFAWDPGATGALWAVLAGANGRAALRAIGAGEGFGASNTPSPIAEIDVGVAFTPGGLLFQRPTATRRPTAWVALPENESLWRVTLASVPRAEVLLPGALGRIGDVVEGEGGVLFVATRNRDGRGTAATGDDLVVRLTPLARRSDLP